MVRLTTATKTISETTTSVVERRPSGRGPVGAIVRSRFFGFTPASNRPRPSAFPGESVCNPRHPLRHVSLGPRRWPARHWRAAKRREEHAEDDTSPMRSGRRRCCSKRRRRSGRRGRRRRRPRREGHNAPEAGSTGPVTSAQECSANRHHGGHTRTVRHRADCAPTAKFSCRRCTPCPIHSPLRGREITPATSASNLSRPRRMSTDFDPLAAASRHSFQAVPSGVWGVVPDLRQTVWSARRLARKLGAGCRRDGPGGRAAITGGAGYERR